MRKPLLFALGFAALGLAAGVAASRRLGTRPDAVPSDPGLVSPLRPCPEGVYNCGRVSRAYAVPPDTLFERARHALEAAGAAEVRANASVRRLDATFRVGPFTDDVTAVVEQHDGGAALHLRSSSRVGRSDAGVNARRLRRILDALG